MCEERFTAGDQVVYVPDHADRKDPSFIFSPQCEFGFVVEDEGSYSIPVRYWRRGNPGLLRTIANSEQTPRRNLLRHQSVHPSVIKTALFQISKTGGDIGFKFEHRFLRDGEPCSHPGCADCRTRPCEICRRFQARGEAEIFDFPVKEKNHA